MNDSFLASLERFASHLRAALAAGGATVTHGYPAEHAAELLTVARQHGFEAEIADGGLDLSARAIRVRRKGAT